MSASDGTPMPDFYPRPPRGGRRTSTRSTPISTSYFYPRPPRGGRQPTSCRKTKLSRFLSTPSARRATALATGASISSGFLSTPSARRATQRGFYNIRPAHDFYPRPPRGGRLETEVLVLVDCGFLSTPSARRATSGLRPGAQDHPISIHALREEGDCPKK